MTKYFTLILVLIIPILSGCTNTVDPETSQEATTEVSELNQTPSLTNDNVPLSQESDVVRTFFNLINEKRSQEAVAMMTDDLIGGESGRKAWLEQFDAFSHVEVIDVKPAYVEEPTETRRVYKTTVNAIVIKGANNPIPFYGWGENPNVRWISLDKTPEGVWQIAGIATGP